MRGIGDDPRRVAPAPRTAHLLSDLQEEDTAHQRGPL